MLRHILFPNKVVLTFTYICDLGCNRSKSKVSHEYNLFISQVFFFSFERFSAVPLLQFLFVSALVVAFVAFILSLFVPHLFFFWCFRRIVAFPLFVVPLLQFVFVRASEVFYVVFVLLVFVLHLFSFRCFGKVVLRDCGISWVSPLKFYWQTFHKITQYSERNIIPEALTKCHIISLSF